jgi:formamidopyrimidine-DNA glycosylase
VTFGRGNPLDGRKYTQRCDPVPELPDVAVYIEALTERIAGRRLERVLVRNPFVLRSVDPPLERVHGAVVRSLRRVGKRIVLVFDAEVFLVIHLMIAGRLRWREPGEKPGVGPKLVLAVFEFEHGTLLFTEAGSKRRASMQVVKGEAALSALDRGGVEPLDVTRDEFREAVIRENHTLKRTLTDPRLFSGIGNAYSDEILHAARLSPLKLSRALNDEEIDRLYNATRTTLVDWTARLRAEAGERFPDKVTAFRDGMAVHGRFKEPCPVCGTPVQRIVYADNECNYCARCQTGGRLLADRSLSRLLKDDWPRSIDDL